MWATSCTVSYIFKGMCKIPSQLFYKQSTYIPIRHLHNQLCMCAHEPFGMRIFNHINQASTHMHAQAVKSDAHAHRYSIILSLQHQTFLLFPELLVSIGNCYPGNWTDREKGSEWAEEKRKEKKNKGEGRGGCSHFYLSFVSINRILPPPLAHTNWKSEES